jgi:hypothetical protein
VTSVTAEFRESIRAIVPQLLSVLKDTDKDVRSEGLGALSKLSKHCMPPILAGTVSNDIEAGFRASIATSIPQILALFKDNNRSVRHVGVKAVSEVFEQGMYHLAHYAEELMSFSVSW